MEVGRRVGASALLLLRLLLLVLPLALLPVPLSAPLPGTDVREVPVPKGTILAIPVNVVQQDPAVWGPDAHAFRPDGTRAQGELVAVLIHCDALLYLALIPGLVRAGFVVSRSPCSPLRC